PARAHRPCHARLREGTGEELLFPPSQELLDLANRLDRDPLKIYSYVRNELDYEPYAGLTKGPERTLLERAGNDLDLAALLASLLRAAGYQARFVRGRIRLSIQQAMDWVGTRDPGLAAAFFTKNGIPAEIESSGPDYTGVILDHTWVRAYLPYLPKGDGRRGEPDTWLDLDPSFKTYRFQYGRDAAAEIGIDPRRFLQELKTQAVINNEQSFVTGIPEEEVYDRLQAWTEGVRQYAERNGLTADTIHLAREIVPEDLGVLPAGLPYQVVEIRSVTENLADDAAVRFTVRGLNAKGQVDLSHTGYLHELAGRRLTISYRPATPEDEEIIREFGGEPGFPAYLVQLVPEIKLDGQVVASGAAIDMGAPQVFEFTYTAPGGADTTRKTLTAGSFSALAMDLQRMPAELVQKRSGDLRLRLQDLKEGRSVDRDDLLGAVLHLFGLNHFLEADRLNAITASALDVAAVRQPSHLLVACDPKIEELFGLPYRVQNLAFASWLGRDLLAPVAKTGEAMREKQFLVTAALTASALQHGIFTQAMAGADAISPLKVVQAANAAKIPVITLDGENCRELLDYLPGLTEAQRTELTDLANAGYELTIPQQEVAIGAWRGNGYLIYDPFTGASRHRFLDADWSGLCPAASLFTGDLFRPSPAQAPLIEALTIWAGRLEEAMAAFAWSFIPAAAALDDWFAAAEIDRAAFIAAAILLSCPIADFVTRPAILNAKITADAFSPNADGAFDTVSLSAELTRESAWQVAVAGAGGGQIRVFQGEGQAVAALWDGLDNQGIPAAEGRYSLTITAVDKEYATQARSVTLHTNLDLTPPAVNITRPAAGGTAQGYLNIVGTVDDLRLASYRVYLGAGENPAAWTELNQGTLPVVEGSLGLIDTYALENGVHSLEIEAADAAGNKTVHRSSFTVANSDSAPKVRITAPAAGAVVSGDLAYAAEVLDDQPGVEVVFYLDGREIARQSEPPFAGTFSTHTLANGAHEINAAATDAAGRTTTAESVRFTTDNVLSELAARPNPFSPNGDGYEDSTQFVARRSSPGV
ncbi:MAG: Ig-like domain-containing protein, partial [Bacteroidota bacterium]